MKKKILAFFLLLIAVALNLYVYSGDSFNQLLEKTTERLFSLISLKQQSGQTDEYTIPEEEFKAHIYMGSDTLISIRHGWIPYYHRHERHEEINKVIQHLVENKVYEERYIAFFALLLYQHPSQLEELKTLSISRKEDEKEYLDQIISEASNYRPVDYSLPVEHDKIWAEYAVTGEIDVVKKYISYLDPAKYKLTAEVIEQIEQYVFESARVYYPVYIALTELKKRTSGPYLEHLHKLERLLSKGLYQAAANAWYEGDNHRKNKKYSEAVGSFMKGLFIAPDYPYLYRILGEVLQEQKRLEDALASLKYAQWTCSDDLEWELWREIGLVYNLMDKHDEVVNAFKEALALDPKEETSLYYLGWAYESVNDIRNAEKCLREALLNDPSVITTNYALDFFRRYNLPLPEREERLLDLFIENKFEKLEAVFSQAQENKLKNNDGDFEVYKFYEKILLNSSAYEEQFEEYIEIYKKWLAKIPRSYHANAGLGMLYVGYAWNARGVGYSNTISSEGWKKFHERLRLAEKYLTKAYKINPTYLGVQVEMMVVAKVHPDMPDSEVDRWFQLALKADPADCRPYTVRAYYLSRKWGGSREEKFRFARDILESAPEDSMAPLALVKAHWAVYYEENDAEYFKRPEVWSEMKAVQTELLRRFPNSSERHNWFAKSACLAEDFAVARREFKAIGENWLESAWSNREEFLYYKKLAFAGD